MAMRDGWISWNGGDCPLDADVDIEVRLRGGEENNDRAGWYEWDHNRANECEDEDIIAYRIIR